MASPLNTRSLKLGYSIFKMNKRFVASVLGDYTSSCALFLHVITGCDTVFCFVGKGNQPPGLLVMSSLSLQQHFMTSSDENMEIIERIITFLYYKTCVI